jgi:hypothetical protein
MIERDAYGEGHHRYSLQPRNTTLNPKFAVIMKQHGLTLTVDVPNGYIGAWLDTVAHQRVHGMTWLEAALSNESRAERTRATLTKFAGFPMDRTFEEYSFKFAIGAPRKQLKDLTGLAFIERKDNVVLLGLSGVDIIAPF